MRDPRMSTPTAPDRLGLAAGFAAVALWAVYNVGSRYAAGQGFVAADLVVLRFVAAGLIGWPLLARLGPNPGLRDLAGLGWGRGIVLALLAGPLFGLLMASGFLRAPLAHAIVFAPASESPMCRTLPAVMRRAIAPTVSSIGTAGSTR